MAWLTFEAFNYRGIKETRDVRGTLVAQLEMVAMVYHPRSGLFTVVYGLQVDSHLDYTQAARKFGEAVLHQARCDGKLPAESAVYGE